TADRATMRYSSAYAELIASARWTSASYALVSSRSHATVAFIAIASTSSLLTASTASSVLLAASHWFWSISIDARTRSARAFLGLAPSAASRWWRTAARS